MTSLKGIRPEATVKARLHQLESAVATSEHLSKHPDQLRKRRDKGRHVPESDSEDDNESNDFADLLRMLTLGSGGSSGHDALHEAFKILDCDEDGYITLADLRQAMNDDDDDDDDDEKLSDDDLLEMIAAADERGNGQISFDSFVKILEPKTAHDKKTTEGNKKPQQKK